MAEGSPDELKRTVGTDLVVVEVDGDGRGGRAVLERLDVVERWPRGDELMARTADGAAAVSPVAVALAEAGIRSGPSPCARRPSTTCSSSSPATGSRRTTVNTTTTAAAAASPTPSASGPARPGFAADLLSVAGRAVRRLPREPESIIPALIVPVFFYVVNVAALGSVAEESGAVGDFKAFQLPVAIIFAVTGVSQANALVTDIQDGLLRPAPAHAHPRLALLLGLMVADLVLVMALTLPVLALGFAYGVRFETGVLGVLAFIVLSGVWGLVFTGFPYAIALKTGNPGAVATSFILFFPFAFLTTSFLPQER